MGWIKDIFAPGERKWEDLYRNRWAYDRVVRSTHGVNCTGSCSWNIYVKNGIVTWEMQALDYPVLDTDVPPYEPRGCQRGISYSWYVYSPLRVKYPFLRGALMDLWHEAKAEHPGDPVAAWRSIVSDPERRARPVSLVTGQPIDIKAGPNWDDDLSGSPLYAENDPNLAALTDHERAQLFEVERLSMMYLPRICNHCANPACVAACPSGAIYKRGEDGIVLINQEKCRGWRACVSACRYKKIYYNWKTGKSEKCILCYPRLETGQPPACFQSCVGRIRYLGVLLYDAEQVPDAMKVPDRALVESQRRVFLDPEDERVRKAAREAGLSEELLEAARSSPVYKWVVEWKLALPLHVEYRTMPMLFYVPPLSPVMGAVEGAYENAGDDLFAGLEDARIPVAYLASLLSAGNVEIVEGVLRKLLAIRYFKRAQDLADVEPDTVRRMLRDAGLTAEEAEAIYALTTLATFEQRFVLPPTQREEALEGLGLGTPELCKGETGFGLVQIVRRGA